MYDRELATEILSQILKATQKVLRRFESIQSPSDFVLSESGLEKFDAICMQLIAIGGGAFLSVHNYLLSLSKLAISWEWGHGFDSRRLHQIQPVIPSG